MSELTRLVRPAQAQVGVTQKECHAEGIKYPTFRQLNKKSRILLSPQYLSTDQNYAYRCLVVSNKQGWFAAIQNSGGNFTAILSPLNELRKSMREASDDNSSFMPQRTLSFSTSEPNILALACNDTRLVVGFKSGQIIVYDTSNVFTSGSDEITPVHVLQSSQQPIIDIASNPNAEDSNLSNLLAVLRVDGTVQVLSTNLELQGGWVAGDADSSPVAVAWSPKGKQLAIGLAHGDILTFALETKASPQRHIPPTTEGNLTSLNWLAPGHTFRTSYAASEPVQHIVFSDKRTSPIVLTQLEHAFQAPDRDRQNSYSAVLPKWDGDADDRLLIVVGDVSCTDLDIIGNIGNEWYQQSQENPLTIPLDKESEDTVLLSLQVDFTDTDATEGGNPIVYAYLNDGTIQGWYVDHPEKKPYAGMVGVASQMSSAINQPQQTLTSAFSVQPAFGQSSAFGNSAFGQATTATSAFGQPSFGQAGFGQAASTPASVFGSSASSNTSSGFASFASNSASPFGAGGFGSSNTASSFGSTSVESAPQITRDESMGDSTSSLGGLSLGGDTEENSKPKSTFGGASGMFGSPSPLPLPPDHPANQSAQQSTFGSAGGSFIKPATGFGAFGGATSGSFGAFSNPAKSNSSAFSGGAFSAKPDQSSALSEAKSGSSFGQSSFGQPSFGQPAFGQSSFGTRPAVSPPSSGGFGAFSSNGPTSFGSAAGSPSASAVKSESAGGGFASFAGTPSAFGTAALGGKNMSGTEIKKEDTSSGASPFGGQSENKPTSPFGNQSRPPAGGAFSSFVSTGPSVFGQPAPISGSTAPSAFGQSGGAFGTPKTEPPGAFGQPANSGGASAGFKSESPSVFSQPSPATLGSAFGESSGNTPGAAPSASIIASQKSTAQPTESNSVKPEPKDTLVKSEPSSPTVPSSPDSDTPSTSQPSSLASKAPSPGAFSNLQTSTSAFKPAYGFGAFGNTMSSSSPFLKANANIGKPVVSAFGDLSASKPAFPISASSPAGPTFGSTSQLGFGFGLKKALPVESPATLSGTSASTTNAFSAFSGTKSPFLLEGEPAKSFVDLLNEGKDKNQDVSSKAMSTVPPKGSPSTPHASDSEVKKESDDDKIPPVVESKSDDKEKGKAVQEHTSHESISSTGSSYVEVNEHEESAEEEEVPGSDEDSAGHPEQQNDDEDGDFLSESYESESEEEEERHSEEVEAKDQEQAFESASTSSSPEPTEIPLPPSRSLSNTPQPETPKVDPTSPTTSDESDSSRLSTIREESTTPPGSPIKSQPQESSAKAVSAPALINPPVSTLGIGRPSTRPTRSSPLANKPLTGNDEIEEEEPEDKSAGNLKPRPASPKTPFGAHPPKSRSTSPEDSKVADAKRPKTPPLLSNFFSAPSTPRPAAATLPTFATPSKPPSAPAAPPPNTSSPSFPAPSSSSSLFGQPFSLQPVRAESAPPKVFTAPPSGQFGSSKSTSPAVSHPPGSIFGTPPPKPQISFASSAGVSQPASFPILPPSAPKLGFQPAASPSPSSSQASGSMIVGPAGPPAPVAVPMVNGMQRECHILVEAIQKELDHLRILAELVAKKRENYFKSVGGSRRKEDLGNTEKWGLSDSTQFGIVLKLFGQDIAELKASTGKQKEEIRDVGKMMIKAGTRREEIARFNKAKSDNEFSKMLKSRTLGPEHLESQTQMRRNIRALRTKVDQLEDQLRAQKKRLTEVKSGRPTIKAPSLDTIHRTYRNIDIALQQQTDDVGQLNARFLKLNLANTTRNASSVRDPRLPTFTSRSRPSILTPDVAVTTAAALNAERSAQKLKTMLLKARKEPLLNVKAKEFIEGGKPIPASYSTPRVGGESTATKLDTGLLFNTPIIRGPLFGGASPPVTEPANWDALSFPEDNFHPSTPLSSGGRRGGTPQRKHLPPPALKKNPVSGSPEAATKVASPATSFDWGPLPTFNKPSPGLPGFDKVISKSPNSPPVWSGDEGVEVGPRNPSSPLPFSFSNPNKGKGKELVKSPSSGFLGGSWVSEGF
ncbi:hypothetical protein GYMLUDRAFT_40753 [Collybiopsis luxurians FD-317 M1]|uniref:Nucleoporin Nup159/Nup146 N-terminal domain-containing protein n=1 Tax=Collybiopsis luxurians FD-317 M1 TaxID=944289 RepID=A0A0D0CL60_9AGAR|nr:hypothetical protein GYMLUDRAFT_40753 [Collybiopsis luxurians FD-317 M1]